MKKEVNIVWLKRDLRTEDHEPFYFAEQSDLYYLPIYIFEPSMISYPDCSLRHLQFVYHSILEINQKLKSFRKEVLIFHEEADNVFEYLNEKFKINTVFSYQESGILKTWKRDISVINFFDKNNIKWIEFQRDGIQRGLENREGWDKCWYTKMHQPILKNKFSKIEIIDFSNPFPLKKNLKSELDNYPKEFQKAGESWGWKYLKSFCEDRGKNYSRHISKPKESRKSCGRISPYLAWGNISVKQGYQFVKNHPNYNNNKRSFNGFLTRLKWHCHFIQKFEMECEYETQCVNLGYESHERTSHPELIEKWKNGTTGFPLVDACMRCLKATGWVNFRMRAMLVSVFCHHFDCDWREGVYHLAKLFLDYEPGIHYTQFQMQAGTTGINTIRMYNPIKQSKDHDPEGIFIKEWIPELRSVPTEYIHEPWKMTEMEKKFYNIEIDYPIPVINIEESGKIARAKIWGHRKDLKVKEENQRIILKHTRNNEIRKKRN